MLATTCPWDRFDHATMDFCERPVCGWITQPANTWSNVGYLVVGALVLRACVRDDMRHLAPIGLSAIAVALGSTLFHASSTFVGEVFDIGGMFLFSGFWLSLDLRRLLGWSRRSQLAVFAASTAASIVLLVLWRTAGVAIFSLQIAGTFSIEGALLRRRRDAVRKGETAAPVRYEGLVWVSGLFLVAYAFWRLDYHRVLCAPDFHLLSGHAMWHLTNAPCFYFLYRFFRQFRALAAS